MVDEPDKVFLRLLREIRTTQEKEDNVLESHGGSLSRLEKRVEYLYKISTHPLGVAVTFLARLDIAASLSITAALLVWMAVR
jgi:hypothetical protein